MQESLVSICVITYNSADTVLETLDSIKNQTYGPLELIISDDFSSDNTLSIVNNWVNKNRQRFVSVKILTVDKNTGVTSNCNRAYKAASAEIIKDISGDDILCPTYIEDCVNFFISNPKCEVLFSKISFFTNEQDFIYKQDDENYEFLSLSAKEQFDWILEHDLPHLPTCAVIYKLSALKKVYYFDERIPMWEDGPMYFRLAENNIKMWLLDKVDVKYRVRSDSISNGRSKRHMHSVDLYRKYYFLKYKMKKHPLKAIYQYIRIFFNSILYGLTK